jgi:TolA-binding protein
MTRAHRGGRPLGRQSLLDRIVRLRRAHAARVDAELDAILEPEPSSLEQLNERINHLEGAVEDLQDSLYRRSLQQDAEIEELRRSTKPGEIARALAADARTRGL